MTDAARWVVARTQQGKNVIAEKIVGALEALVFDAATKAITAERIPLPMYIFFTAVSAEALIGLIRTQRVALGLIQKISAQPEGTLFAHALCEGGAPVVVVGYDGQGGVTLAKVGAENSWGLGYDGEVTVPMAQVHEIRNLTVKAADGAAAPEITQTTVILGAMKRCFDRDVRPLRYQNEMERAIREGGDWVGHKMGQRRINEAQKDLSRFMPKLLAHLKENNGIFPVTQDPLLAECVLFCARACGGNHGRCSSPPRAAKGIVTASAAGAHLIDERCGAISFVSDLLV